MPDCSEFCKNFKRILDPEPPTPPEPTPDPPKPDKGMLKPAGQWLKRDGKKIYLCGPGDPERKAFLKTRDRITRNNIKFGGNIYPWYACQTHGGDSHYYPNSHTYNPFRQHRPGANKKPFDPRLDPVILNSWEQSFNLADSNDIITMFTFLDDESDPFESGRDVILEVERNYFIQLVQRYRHHRNWIWLIQEEWNEKMSSGKVRKLAQLIKQHDPYHPVAVHATGGINRYPFKSFPHIDIFMVQYNDAGAGELKTVLTQAVKEARGRYCVVLYENTEPGLDVMGHGNLLKRKMQACADAGAGVMVYDRGMNRFTKQDLLNMRALQKRMERKING